jgi:hypothetical protein
MGRATSLAGWLLPGVLRRFRVLVILAVVGIAVFGGIVPLASSSAEAAATAKEGLGSPALRAVMLSASGGAGAAEKPLNGDSMTEIRGVDGVEAAVGWSQALLTVERGSAAIFPDLTPRFAPLQPTVIVGREPKADGEVLLSAAMIEELGIEVGDTVDATYNRYLSAGLQEGVDVEVTVVGAYDATTVGVDGERAAYGPPSWVDAVLAAQQGVPTDRVTKGLVFQYVYVVATSREEVPSVVEQLRSHGYSASSLSSLLSGVQPVQAVLDLLRTVVAALLVVFLLIVAGTVATSVLVSKRGEIGLLRAFGWQRRQVLWAFLLQFGALGAVIGVLGAALAAAGLAVLAALFPEGLFGLPIEVGLSPATVGVLAMYLVVPPALFVLGAMILALRAASTPPDEVLRDLTP